ncbi:hypothetical protein WJX73_006536 [Symbiochloris irregularis]|uniref:Uncharacterized protein n=1 Tax=Symbiochloris irregularis TaxID=706552 RepID=A0AAW1P7F6_9CHLO
MRPGNVTGRRLQFAPDKILPSKSCKSCRSPPARLRVCLSKSSLSSASESTQREPQPLQAPPSAGHRQKPGQVPNLLWQGITYEELRQSPKFQALPPFDPAFLSGAWGLRNLRHDARPKDLPRLGGGICSASLLNAVLGFHEHRAAKALSLPGVYRNHAHTVQAFQNLRAPVQMPAFPDEVKAYHAMVAAESKPLLDSAGLDALRTAWGTAQEAASIVELIQAFPSDEVREVGLWWLDPAELPAEWGFAEGSLPPMVASPDAIIEHRWLGAHIWNPLDTPDVDLDEPVEVKNTCPFRFYKGSTGEMLWRCQSATRGTTIFRVHKHEERSIYLFY